jgi:hypothetical protein
VYKKNIHSPPTHPPHFSIYLNFDGFVKSRQVCFSVIPEKAGIQYFWAVAEFMDSGLRRSDDSLRVYQNLSYSLILNGVAQLLLNGFQQNENRISNPKRRSAYGTGQNPGGRR